MKFPVIGALAAASALTLSAAPVAAAPWTIVDGHGAVTFSVEHFGFSSTPGLFRDFSADIDFDPEDIESSSVSFTIDAASIDTNWEARDEHIRSGDFLAVEEYPEITFVSTSVNKTGEDTAEVVGDVTMKGETNEEAFTATMKRIGPNPLDEEQTIAGFVVEGEIDRTDYGVSYAAPAVGAVIPIRLDLEITPEG